MKDLSLLVWLTQLGFSVVFPLAGFVLLAVWLRDHLGWGSWVLWVGLILGLYCAIQGFRSSIKAMQNLAKDPKSPKKPPVSFNEHH